MAFGLFQKRPPQAAEPAMTPVVAAAEAPLAPEADQARDILDLLELSAP